MGRITGHTNTGLPDIWKVIKGSSTYYQEDYSFNETLKLLDNRTDSRSSEGLESFANDNLDRLTTGVECRLDGIGNIDVKEGMEYQYDNTSPHGRVRKLNYIYLGGRLAAVYVEEGGTGQLHGIATDYLGSVQKIFTSTGTVRQNTNYNAWGNRRNPTYQTLILQPNPTDYFISRGFTGHEHIDEFNLINMNGRVYDPALGVFLSPDPYVQAPGFSPNFNRYSYCLNNPLIYTDPSGEILVPILIGAGISVLTNGISNSVNDRPFFEGAGKAAIIGGIGGAFSFGIGQAAAGMSGFGKVAFQTLAHGHLGGMMSGMSGGTYGQGFLSGAAGSLVATGAGSLFSDASKGVQALGTIGGGALAGGIGAEIAGGNFWDGARNGAISAGLNHGIHSGLFGEGLMMASITGRTRHLFWTRCHINGGNC
ncbi:MAG: RHS repeat-associated core domain-containing protein [Bacteroidales bacterium]|nr:RHS repeat-associated core domain-containing protein [Bacteroidales bacterium]